MIFSKDYPKWIALSCFVLLAVLLSALYLPMIYARMFFDEVGKTHLFYSPVTRDFIFTEKVVGKVPEEVQSKSEDHHAQLAYKRLDQGYVSRVEFEKLLPFIYYKNMDIWGLLPLKIGEQEFDREQIKKHRRVMELKAREIPGHSPVTPVFPLFESNPGQARLVFPDDRFQMTSKEMEFINADTNQVDENLTRIFTQALKEKGCMFPIRQVNGKFTVLKPFDEGIFLVDDQYQVFHVRRVNGKPKVVKTPIDPGIKTRCIKVSENRQKEYYGILLGENGKVFLISYDGYALIPLHVKGYVPDSMDLKLIFNPLYCTAIFSDASKIYAVVMDKNFETIKTHSQVMSRASMTPEKIFYQILFPFVIEPDEDSSDFVSIRFVFNGWAGAMGMAICFFGYGFWCFFVIRRPPSVGKAVLVAMFGIYGIVAVNITGMEV